MREKRKNFLNQWASVGKRHYTNTDNGWQQIGKLESFIGLFLLVSDILLIIGIVSIELFTKY